MFAYLPPSSNNVFALEVTPLNGATQLSALRHSQHGDMSPIRGNLQHLTQTTIGGVSGPLSTPPESVEHIVCHSPGSAK